MIGWREETTGSSIQLVERTYRMEHACHLLRSVAAWIPVQRQEGKAVFDQTVHGMDVFEL